jgi:hypothetical protein
VKSSVQTAKNRSQAKKVEQSLNYEADILPKTNHNELQGKQYILYKEPKFLFFILVKPGTFVTGI